MIRVHLVDFEHRLVLQFYRSQPNGLHFTYSSNIDKTIKHANKGDIVFVYNYHMRKSIHKLVDKGCIVYPTPTMSEICASRERTCRVIDDLTRFPLIRKYYPPSPKYIITPVEGMVYKIGNEQQGENKFKLGDRNKIYTYYEPYIEEEFVEGRSIRVLWTLDRFTLIEQKSDSWIKNTGNVEETIIEYDPKYDPIIKDSKYIKNKLRRCFAESPTIGFDYVVGEKTGLLEFNDMCGIPENKETEMLFLESVIHFSLKLN